MMTTWLSLGLGFTFLSILFILTRWGNHKCVGPMPVHVFTFIAILFTSGLDVGLIMFPLTEFAGYADLATSPEYGFANPLAIEFGFWGFLIWGFYFLTCFYFCVIEPKVKFFEIPLVKLINNIVIIGTCAFTAYLLLANLPWYLPQIGDGSTVVSFFYVLVFLVIALAVYSSTNIKYVRILSLASTWLFLSLIVVMAAAVVLLEQGSVAGLASTTLLLGDYFKGIHHFAFPLNDYHEFYLYWWFAWSIMIGQFTSRFVGGLKTYQILLAMLIFPSIPIALWFSVLYYSHVNAIEITGILGVMMVVVGVTFVINSLDSLIRLYTDNLNLTVQRFGKVPYFMGNLVVLSGLTLLFKLDFLQIQWVGALVIGIFFACFAYILLKRRCEVMSIRYEADGLKVDYHKIETVT